MEAFPIIHSNAHFGLKRLKKFRRLACSVQKVNCLLPFFSRDLAPARFYARLKNLLFFHLRRRPYMDGSAGDCLTVFVCDVIPFVP